jgi:hypothetical protein
MPSISPFPPFVAWEKLLFSGAMSVSVKELSSGSEFPLASLVMFLYAAVTRVCAYLLLFSRSLRTGLKSRRLLNHEAARVAYQKYMSELDQP